jgi:ribosomal protein S18 acetylase RimI-like enzyme
MARVWIATSADAASVTRLLGRFRDWFGGEPSDDELERSVNRLLGDRNTDYLLAAESDGEAAGICQLRFRYGVWLTAEDCCLEDLYVADEARRAGLGRALVEAAIERAAKRGCRRIELDTNERNTQAIALYESVGFTARPDPEDGRNLFLRRRLDG